MAANDIIFSLNGSVSTTASVSITAGNDKVGWYSAANPSNFRSFDSSSGVGNTYAFTPGGDFGVYEVNLATNPAQGYDSEVVLDTADPGVRHGAPG